MELIQYNERESNKFEVNTLEELLPLLREDTVSWINVGIENKELVENAIKYNKEGGRIIISTGEDEASVILQIADTGIGIEENSLQKIFELFEQVENSSYTRKYEGAGLGLSLSNKLISFMNGKMSIASQLNEGTTVTISFPKKINE